MIDYELDSKSWNPQWFRNNLGEYCLVIETIDYDFFGINIIRLKETGYEFLFQITRNRKLKDLTKEHNIFRSYQESILRFYYPQGHYYICNSLEKFYIKHYYFKSLEDLFNSQELLITML